MKAHIFRLAIGMGMIAACFSGAGCMSAQHRTGDEVVRIGIYDSRAIAVAYAASAFNPVSEKVKAYEQAKAAGDQNAIRELEAWGETHQRMLHFQGFGSVPVHDLLIPIEERLSEVATRLGLDAIVMAADWTSGDAEVVDVTGDLVALYNPTEETLRMTREIQRVDPVPLTELARMRADE